MTISIADGGLPNDDHNIFDVTFYSDRITTHVTDSPSLVDSWISETLHIHSRRLNRLIVGLDVEWRPNHSNTDNPVATLQLCVGRRCLIFQIIHAPSIPESLIDFLGEGNFTFVGVGVHSDVEKLLCDYNLSVKRVLDLGDVAANRLGRNDLRHAGLKNLARDVLGKAIDKPRNVTMSRWDCEWLSYAQIQYACVDAFISFEIGRCLNASEY